MGGGSSIGSTSGAGGAFFRSNLAILAVLICLECVTLRNILFSEVNEDFQMRIEWGKQTVSMLYTSYNLKRVITNLANGESSHYVIQRRDKPVAVMVSFDRYQELISRVW